jgi:lysophospholipase L1-like esterase
LPDLHLKLVTLRFYLTYQYLIFFLSVTNAVIAQRVESAPTAEQVAERRKKMDDQLRNDWAQTARYAAANEKLISSHPRGVGPVYIGDSITELWWKYDSAFWKDNGYVDRGISAQTSAQMLVRFRRDVVDLKPAVVIINAGTNDIAGNTGPISLEHVLGNIMSMADIASSNKINVVLTSVLPAAEFPWRKGKEPAPKVIKLNAMIREFASAHDFVYVDYWTPLADEVNGLDAKYSADGVHPNLEGYRIMEPILKKAVDESMTKTRHR